MYNTLIDPEALSEQLQDPTWVVVDCRFDLKDVEAGRAAYLDAHIPGAVYAHLDDDMSGPPLTDTGRHPLPAPESLVQTFSRLGIDGEKQVVAYDDAGGAIAARLWWMLRYMGHDSAAVLNGGWAPWLDSGLPTAAGEETNPVTEFAGEPRIQWRVLLKEVANVPLLVDSRDPARYRGEFEPLDRVPGHIPGAVNYSYGNNLDDRGFFLSPKQLRDRLENVLGDTPAAEAVYYCGSGVTACHNLLASAHAGLPNPRLYVGSWSEWCQDPDRCVTTGPDPGRMPS